MSDAPAQVPPVLDAAWLAARRGWIAEKEAREVFGDRAVSLEELVEHGFLSAQQARDLVPPEALAAAPDPKNLYARYIRYKELGHGGFGTVWLAWDIDLGRPVALKLLHEHEPSELARFRREAQAVARLSHPNIVAVHDVGEANGEPYIAMQYVAGEPVGTRAFPPGVALRIASQAADALAYAHAQGVIHRDIKPGNILLDDMGKAYLMDFGLAKNLRVDTTLSATGEVFGTPGFMPPEQATGEILKMGPHTDVWGLGATLYALLTGNPPFDGPNPYDIVKKVMEEPPVPPTRLVPRLSRDVEAVVLRCLEKDPARRYKTAVELADDLRRCLEGETPAAALTGALLSRKIRAIRQSVMRRRVPILVASTALALASAALALLLLWPDPLERAARPLAEAKTAYVAGRLPECEAKLHDALGIVPDHAEALFWLGRLNVRRYAQSRELPPAYIVGGYLTFESPAADAGPGLADALRLLERAEAARAKYPQLPFPKGAAQLVRGVEALYRGDAAHARGDLERAFREMGPDERWIGGLVAEAFYYAEDFDDGIAWIRAKQDPRAATAIEDLLKVRMLHAKGLASTLRGGDPRPEYAAALDTCRFWLDPTRAALQKNSFRLVHAQLHLALGQYLEDHGQDPRPDYAEALAKCREVLALDAQSSLALHAQGDHTLAVAEHLNDRGQVPPDTAEPYPDAVRHHAEGTALSARWAQGWTKKGLALEAVARYWLSVGQPDRAKDAYEDARADFARADQVRGGREIVVRLALARVAGILDRWPRDPPPDPAGVEEWDARMEQSFTREAEAVLAAADLRRQYGPAWLELGRAHAQWAEYRERRGVDASEQYAAALEVHERACAIPDYAHAHLARGQGRLQRGRYKADRGEDPAEDYAAAVEDFSRALAIKGDLVDAYLGRADAHERLATYRTRRRQDPGEEFDLAQRDLEAAQGVNPNHAQVHTQRAALRAAIAYARRGQRDPFPELEAAVGDLSRAIDQINPRYAPAFLARAAVHNMWGSFAWSRQDRTAAREHWQEAMRDLDAAVGLNRIDPERLYARGRAHYSLATAQDLEAELQDALRDFTEAERLNPTWFRFPMMAALTADRLARTRLERDADPEGYPAQAHDTFLRALAMNPNPRDRVALLRYLCVNRAQAGDLEAAQAAFGEARALAPAQELDALADFGYALHLAARARKDDLEGAARLFDEALRRLDEAVERSDPAARDTGERLLRRAEVRCRRGALRVQAGAVEDLHGAIEDAERAKTLNRGLTPEADEILRRAREALARLGEEY